MGITDIKIATLKNISQKKIDIIYYSLNYYCHNILLNFIEINRIPFINVINAYLIWDFSQRNNFLPNIYLTQVVLKHKMITNTTFISLQRIIQTSFSNLNINILPSSAIYFNINTSNLIRNAISGNL